MKRPRYNTSRDANQAEIMDDLRRLGFYVRDVSAFIAEWDIEVYGNRLGVGWTWAHFEIKTKTGDLQPSQRRFVEHWGADSVPVARCTEDVLRWFGRVDEHRN